MRKQRGGYDSGRLSLSWYEVVQEARIRTQMLGGRYSAVPVSHQSITQLLLDINQNISNAPTPEFDHPSSMRRGFNCRSTHLGGLVRTHKRGVEVLKQVHQCRCERLK